MFKLREVSHLLKCLAHTLGNIRQNHCVRSVCIRSYSGMHFPAFRLNAERYSIFSPNAGKCGPE